LEITGDRVRVQVYDEASVSRPRKPTPDEVKELEAALERSFGVKVAVYPYEAS
jgi:hypothetical protein